MPHSCDDTSTFLRRLIGEPMMGVATWHPLRGSTTGDSEGWDVIYAETQSKHRIREERYNADPPPPFPTRFL